MLVHLFLPVSTRARRLAPDRARPRAHGARVARTEVRRWPRLALSARLRPRSRAHGRWRAALSRAALRARPRRRGRLVHRARARRRVLGVLPAAGTRYFRARLARSLSSSRASAARRRTSRSPRPPLPRCSRRARWARRRRVRPMARAHCSCRAARTCACASPRAAGLARTPRAGAQPARERSAPGARRRRARSTRAHRCRRRSRRWSRSRSGTPLASSETPHAHVHFSAGADGDGAGDASIALAEASVYITPLTSLVASAALDMPARGSRRPHPRRSASTPLHRSPHPRRRRLRTRRAVARTRRSRSRGASARCWRGARTSSCTRARRAVSCVRCSACSEARLAAPALLDRPEQVPPRPPRVRTMRPGTCRRAVRLEAATRTGARVGEHLRVRAIMKITRFTRARYMRPRWSCCLCMYHRLSTLNMSDSLLTFIRDEASNNNNLGAGIELDGAGWSWPKLARSQWAGDGAYWASSDL
jgi:hypothetical protein